MTPVQIIDIGQKAVLMGIKIALPILGLGLIVGLIISILQAATQIQEMTLTFVPKLFAVAIVILFLGKWMLNQMMIFTFNLISSIPTLIR